MIYAFIASYTSAVPAKEDPAQSIFFLLPVNCEVAVKSELNARRFDQSEACDI